MTTQTKPTQAELEAELVALRAQNAELASQVARQPKPTLKVTDKGGVSLYGMGRWPTTLYPEQWETVLSMTEEIKAFMMLNRAKLNYKHTSGS